MGSASTIGQSLASANLKHFSVTAPAAAPRDRDLTNAAQAARDSFLSATYSGHSATLRTTIAEPVDALLSEMAHTWVSAGVGTTSAAGEESFEVESGLPEIRKSASKRLSVWVASGVITIGTRIAFRRLGVRKKPKIDARLTSDGANGVNLEN